MILVEPARNGPSKIVALRGIDSIDDLSTAADSRYRRSTKNIRKVCVAVVLIGFSFSGDSSAKNGPAYRVVDGWPAIPENEMLDEVSAVAVDRAIMFWFLQEPGESGPSQASWTFQRSRSQRYSCSMAR